MTQAPNGEAWAVYLLECADGRVYTGIARDPGQRYAKHLAGKGARFTRANPPRRLLGWVWVADHGTALRLELAWKHLPRAQRIAALHAHPTMNPQGPVSTADSTPSVPVSAVSGHGDTASGRTRRPSARRSSG